MKFTIKVYSRRTQNYIVEYSCTNLDKHIILYESVIREFSDVLYDYNILTKVEED